MLDSRTLRLHKDHATAVESIKSKLYKCYHLRLSWLRAPTKGLRPRFSGDHDQLAEDSVNQRPRGRKMLSSRTSTGPTCVNSQLNRQKKGLLKAQSFHASFHRSTGCNTEIRNVVLRLRAESRIFFLVHPVGSVFSLDRAIVNKLSRFLTAAAETATTLEFLPRKTRTRTAS